MYDKLSADVEFLKGNYAASAEMYREGARDGDATAAFNYGYMLWRGLGVLQDSKEAKSFFAFARDIEGGAACYNLAMLYLHGDGVAQDFGRAIEYMTVSAEKGCIEAQLYMGMAYTLGCAFEPDIIGICMIPYHKSEYRDFEMQFLPGYTPDYDREDARFAVIRADARRAFEWFRTAARHDPTYVADLVAKGQYLYAKCFIDGLGTDFDRAKGTRIMMLAGKNGSEEAVGFLRENGVTPAMIAESTRLDK